MPQEKALAVQVILPEVTDVTTSIVAQLTTALGLPREILASDDDINQAWRELPVVLNRIPPHLRDPILARMCVAASVGLLDSAIIYAWNAAMIELRGKVRAFGINIVPQIINKDFDEKILLDMQDAELLSLCLSLNLITEEGYFMLDQSRDVRNNFSAAHPSIGAVDGLEFLNFLSRCAKFALNNQQNPRGVDFNVFIAAVKGGRFDAPQLAEWVQRLRATHDAQRELLDRESPRHLLRSTSRRGRAAERARLGGCFRERSYGEIEVGVDQPTLRLQRRGQAGSACCLPRVFCETGPPRAANRDGAAYDCRRRVHEADGRSPGVGQLSQRAAVRRAPE